MEFNLLDKINSPEDVKAVPEKEMPRLAEEIRAFLIENTELTGGHLASNLGVVELTLALHRVFDSPRDHIIFDVGHQSYVHKILTGRKSELKNLRRTGGLSGFTSMRESEHDAFGAGHSSTSVSAGLGYAEADLLKGNPAFTVAVMGDGAFTGGMAHEAINNCKPELPLIIILNDNGMSISVNKGAFAGYLSKVRFSRGYRRFKRGTKSFIHKIPLLGRAMNATLSFFKNRVKNMFFSPNYFEDLGLYYIGAIDGNDYKKVEEALLEAKALGECTIIHIKTQKGKGYEPAEKNPDDFHSVSAAALPEKPHFNKIFAEKLMEIAENDESVVAVTAAMGIGTGLSEFEKKFPKRYFDVGIAEEHALTFSAGLAANGLKPFTAIYSTFLQRGYDSIVHDIALQGLPVKIMIDRASLAVADGATHHGIFDVSFLSHVPGFEIYSPVTRDTLRLALDEALVSENPVAIRYANAAEDDATLSLLYPNGAPEKLGIAASFKPGDEKKIFITYGNITSRVVKACELLKNSGISVGVIAIEKLRPYKNVAELILPYIKDAEKLVFVEEGIKNGGAAVTLREELIKLGYNTQNYEIVAIDDNFASPSLPCELYEYLGMSPEALSKHFIRISE